MRWSGRESSDRIDPAVGRDWSEKRGLCTAVNPCHHACQAQNFCLPSKMLLEAFNECTGADNPPLIYRQLNKKKEQEISFFHGSHFTRHIYFGNTLSKNSEHH
jgi:hypothetical protein